MIISSIKRVKEKNLNETEKQVEITFEASEKEETVTLTGEGSVKVLQPV